MTFKKNKTTYNSLIIVISILIVYLTIIANSIQADQNTCFNSLSIHLQNQTNELVMMQLDLFKATWSYEKNNSDNFVMFYSNYSINEQRILESNENNISLEKCNSYAFWYNLIFKVNLVLVLFNFICALQYLNMYKNSK